MDAFEEMMKRKRRKRRRLALGVGIGFLLLAAVAYVFLFYINRFGVELSLNGEREVILEYGENFADPGAKAQFSGSILLKNGKEIPVTAEGNVDTGTVGTYTLRYTAAYHKWHAVMIRTVRVVDIQAPEITLNGSQTVHVAIGQEYAEEGFTAQDNYDGDITARVWKVEEDGKITYRVEDSSGNAAQISREIVYYDPSIPLLTLLGDPDISIPAGTAFTEPGYTAWDDCDGDLTGNVAVSGAVDIYHAGTYTLTYQVTDSFGSTASAVRTVTVAPVPQPETVSPSGKVIYLTFDDGPGPYTRQLLDILKKYNVKATFFVINSDYIDFVKDIAAEGHTVGIHSVCHDYHTIYASEEAYFADLQLMQQIIAEKTGIMTTLLRFPGGSSNTVSCFNEGIMTSLTRAVTDMGFQYFDWNVDSDDAGKAKKTEKVFENVTAGVEKWDVSIVLQHDVKGYSVDAVEEIILWGMENGYTFLPLDATSPKAHHEVNN